MLLQVCGRLLGIPFESEPHGWVLLSARQVVSADKHPVPHQAVKCQREQRQREHDRDQRPDDKPRSKSAVRLADENKRDDGKSSQWGCDHERQLPLRIDGVETECAIVR